VDSSHRLPDRPGGDDPGPGRRLGIDVGSLDVALVTGFPGTMTSLWQRGGRAGRAGKGWAVLVGGQDALDQYFMREPERLLSRAV